MPERTRHLAFGDVAAAWGMLDELGVAAIIDEACGARRADAGASAGSYLVLAALNRLVAPCSKLAFADWWKTTAADRFTKIGAGVLDHRRFWDAMHAVTLGQLEQASEKVAAAIVQASGVDVSSVALDMTNFATFIATSNGKAPIALVNMNAGGGCDGEPGDCGSLRGDGGCMALRRRPAGGVVKPPAGALAEDRGAERRGKSRGMIPAGEDQGDGRWPGIWPLPSEAPKGVQLASEPGPARCPGMSLGDTRLLPRRCPAYRQHEPGPGTRS